MNSNKGDYDVFIDEFNKYEEKFLKIVFNTMIYVGGILLGIKLWLKY